MSIETKLLELITITYTKIQSLRPVDGFSAPRDTYLVTEVNKLGAVMRHLESAMHVFNPHFEYDHKEALDVNQTLSTPGDSIVPAVKPMTSTELLTTRNQLIFDAVSITLTPVDQIVDLPFIELSLNIEEVLSSTSDLYCLTYVMDCHTCPMDNAGNRCGMFNSTYNQVLRVILALQPQIRRSLFDKLIKLYTEYNNSNTSKGN